MSRFATATAARLLLVSLPLAFTYPQAFPPFKFPNDTVPAPPVSTGISGEMTNFNISDPEPLPISDPVPISEIIPIGDDFTPVDLPFPLYTDIPAPESIYIDPIWPPPMDGPGLPTVSFSTFVSVVRPLLDMVDDLWWRVPDNSMSRPMPYGLGPLNEKRDTAAAAVALDDDASKKFKAITALIAQIVQAIKGIIKESPVDNVLPGSTLDTVPSGTLLATSVSTTIVAQTPVAAVASVASSLVAAASVLPSTDVVTNVVPVDSITEALSNAVPVGSITNAVANVVPVGSIASALSDAVPVNSVADAVTGAVGGATRKALRARQVANLKNLLAVAKPATSPVTNLLAGAGTSGLTAFPNPLLAAGLLNPAALLAPAIAAATGGVLPVMDPVTALLTGAATADPATAALAGALNPIGAIANALDPVTDVVSPVTDVVSPVTDVVSSVTDVVNPVADVAHSVVDLLLPSTGSSGESSPFPTSPLAPLAALLSPVTAALEPITDALSAVIGSITPDTSLLDNVVNTAVEPLINALEPVTDALPVSSSDLAPVVSALEPITSLLPVDVANALPSLTPVGANDYVPAIPAESITQIFKLLDMLPKLIASLGSLSGDLKKRDAATELDAFRAALAANKEVVPEVAQVELHRRQMRRGKRMSQE